MNEALMALPKINVDLIATATGSITESKSNPAAEIEKQLVIEVLCFVLQSKAKVICVLQE